MLSLPVFQKNNCNCIFWFVSIILYHYKQALRWSGGREAGILRGSGHHGRGMELLLDGMGLDGMYGYSAKSLCGTEFLFDGD